MFPRRSGHARLRARAVWGGLRPSPGKQGGLGDRRPRNCHESEDLTFVEPFEEKRSRIEKRPHIWKKQPSQNLGWRQGEASWFYISWLRGQTRWVADSQSIYPETPKDDQEAIHKQTFGGDGATWQSEGILHLENSSCCRACKILVDFGFDLMWIWRLLDYLRGGYEEQKVTQGKFNGFQ